MRDVFFSSWHHSQFTKLSSHIFLIESHISAPTMGNCISEDGPSRRSSHRSRRHSHRSHHRHHSNRNDELPSDWDLSAAPAYASPTSPSSQHQVSLNQQLYQTSTATAPAPAPALQQPPAPSLPGPHQTTASLQFPVTTNHELLESWGCGIHPASNRAAGGKVKHYQRIMFQESENSMAHRVAELRIPTEDELIVTTIDTENVPSRISSPRRPRARASNILLAFWTGSGHQITGLRRIKFESVIEPSTRGDAAPMAYNMMGIGLFEQKLKIRPENGEAFRYVAETSRLARLVWSMLQCQEMRQVNMQMEELYFRPHRVRGTRTFPSDCIPFDFEVKLSPF